MLRTKEGWERIYQDKQTPWDSNQPEPYLVKLVTEGVVKPCTAIDLGCGTGNEAVFLAKHRFTVTGVDVSETAIKKARKKAKSANVTCKFIVSDVLNIPLDKKYDFAIDRACFHFLDPKDQPHYIQNLKSILKPGALFLLVVSSEQETAKGPHQFSKADIRRLFLKDFKILSIELVILETHKEKPRPYICLMQKNEHHET